MASFYGEDASKQALRSAYLDLPTLSPSHKARLDGDILAHLRAFPGYRKADLIIVFISQREETDTRAAIDQALADGKTVAIADIGMDGQVTLRNVADGNSVMTVTEEELAASVCLVPGLIFDAEGYRVAYAAGYIDNYLSTYPGCKVALTRAVQIGSNPLPHEEHDVPVDVLVSDSCVWMCRR